MNAERVRLGRAQTREQGAVDQQPPHLLKGHLADQFIDVDSPVAQRSTGAVGFRYFGGESDYAL